MEIHVVKGTGTGPTDLAAYDSALYAAGIEHNLIYLSSIIPAGATVVTDPALVKVPGEYGDRLYAVVATQTSKASGEGAWAGLGWVQSKEGSEGLFVEHHGTSKEEVEDDIKNSLKGLIDIRDQSFGPIEMVVDGIVCNGATASVIVAAIFKAESWF